MVREEEEDGCAWVWCDVNVLKGQVETLTAVINIQRITEMALAATYMAIAGRVRVPKSCICPVQVIHNTD
jgi:hypothetical protein